MINPYADYNALKTIGVYYPRPDMSVPAGPFVREPAQEDKTTNYLFDYNDPLAVNSVVDILFNEAALNKHYARPNDILGQPDVADFEQRIIASLDLLKRSAIDPIAGRVSKATNPTEVIEGVSAGVGDTVLNTLMNLGETMDIAANPIKGAILDKDGPTKGFLRGLGTTEEGRYNYDYNVQTGVGAVDFVANMALEVISDPLNWVSLGSKALGTVGAKALLSVSDDLIQEASERAVREVITETAEEAVPVLTREARENLAQQIARNVARNPEDISKTVVNTVKSSRIPDFYKSFFTNASTAASKNLTTTVTEALTKYTSEHLLYTTIKGLNKVDAVLDNFQKGLLYSTLATGLGAVLPPSILRGKLAELFVAATNRAKLALPNAEAPYNIITFDVYDDALTRMKNELIPIESQSSELAGLSELIPQNVFLSGQKTYLADVLKTFQKYAETVQRSVKDGKAGSAFLAMQKDLDNYHLGLTKGAYNFSAYVDLAVARGATVPSIKYIADTLVSLRTTLNMIASLNEPKRATDVLKSFGNTQGYISDMFSKSLDPLSDPARAKYFQKLGTPSPKGVQIDLSKVKDYVIYTSKNAQAYAYAQILDAQSETLGPLIKDIYTGSGIMSLLSAHATQKGVSELIEHLEVAAQGYVAQMQFTQACLANPELRTIFPRIYDAMQTYATTSLATIEAGNFRNTNYYVEKIIDNVNLQLAELSNKGHNLKLDFLFSKPERYAAFSAWAAEKYPGVELRQMHDAVQDSMAAEYLFYDPDLLAEYATLIDPATHTSVFLDFETSGLHSAVDQILQVGVTVNGVVYDWKISTGSGYKPSSTVMRLLSGSDDPVIQQKFFNETYSEDANNTTPEAVVIAQLHDLLKALAMDGKPVQIVGQNVENFEREFLFRRAIKSGVSTADAMHLRNYPMVDTLKLLREKFNIQTLSDVQSSTLRTQLLQYLFSRRSEIMSVYSSRKFIDGFDGKILQDLEFLQKDIKETVQDTALETLQTATASVLQSIGLVNKKLSEQAIFYDPVNKVILDKTGNAIEPEGLMSIMRLTGGSTEEYITHAFKKEFDTRVHQTYFPARDIKNSKEILEGSLALQEYRIAVDIERKLRRIKDLQSFLEHQHDLEAYTTKMLRMLSPYFSGLSRLKIDSLSTSQLVATAMLLEDYALRLAKKTHTYDVTEPLLRDIRYDESFKDLVRNVLRDVEGARQENIYSSAKYASAELNTTALFEVPRTEATVARARLDAGILSIKQQNMKMLDDLSFSKKDILDELSRGREHLDILSATAQAEAAILQRLARYIDAFEEYTTWDSKETDLELKYQEAATFTNRYGDDYGDLSIAAVAELVEKDLPNFKRHLFTHAQGYITFRIPTPNMNLLYTRDANNTLLHTYKNAFLQRADELLEQGIRVTYNDYDGRFWITLEDSHFNDYLAEEQRILAYYKEHGEYPSGVEFPILKKHLVDTPCPDKYWGHSKELTTIFRAAEDYMHTLTRGASLGSLGDTLTYENLEDIYKMLPESLRSTAVHPSKFKAVAQHFDRVVFNHSNIGPIVSRKDIMPMVSRDVFKNYANTIQHMVRRFDDRMKLTYLFFDPAQSLNGPYYKGLSDKDLFEIVQKHSEYTLAGLKKHPKYGLIVQEYKAPSVAEFRRLRADSSVTLMPTQTFLKAWHVINDFKIGNNASALLRKFVISPTKTGYLMTTGWLVRNLVDSYIKNVMLTGSFTEAGSMLRHTLETAKLYNTYKRTLEGIYKEAQLKYGTDAKELFSRKIASDYLKNQNLISEEDFFTLHNFIEQGPSAGISKEQQRLLQMRHERKTGKKDSYNLLYDNKYTTFIMDTNSEIEQIMRLSGYTWALDRGATVDAAMGLVKKNHFDYTVKTPAMLYAEYVVPFLSFTINNTAFWLDSFDKDPWLASIFRDIMTPVWNFDEYSNMELNNNRSLQYHLLAGNIVDPDTNLVFKLNPSITDAIKLLTDPTEWYERILPVVRLPLEILAAHMSFDPEANTYETESQTIMRKVLENIPYAGPTIQRYWGADLEAMFTGKADAPTGEDYRYRGSVQKGLERVTTAAQLTAFVPSLFGGVQRNYYFAYGDGQVFMTHSPEKLSDNLKKGAIEIYAKDDPRVVSAFRRWAQKSYPTKLRMAYPNKGSRVKKPYVKKFRAKRSYFKKHYPPKQYATNVQARIRKFVRGSQFRMPGSFRNTNNPAPTLYKRLYTAKGTARFKQRMVPVTAANLAAKLRSDWYYLRG